MESMKAKILALLRERSGFVSGQELCERFSVSRTAVWKAVHQLQKEGYQIEAVQNRGYRLTAEPEEDYTQSGLVSRLQTQWAGRPTKFYGELGSTNTQAKLEAENGAGAGTLIVAERQTAGRGRRGRSWSSPAGANLYFTLILRPDFAPDKASMLTLLMAHAAARGIALTLEKAGIGGDRAALGIKWPNDLVAEGRKVCGILTEMSAERDYIQYVVIGVGVNVRKQKFSAEIADRAASLEEVYGCSLSRCALLAEILAQFESDYAAFCETEDLSALRERYNALLINRGREVCVLEPGGEYRGVADGINDAGELLVELADGTVREVFAGEVSVRGVYGYV